MKQILLIVLCFCSVAAATSQDLGKHLATAKTAYSANKLEEAHFALKQAIAEVDILTGKKVLQLLPASLEGMPANSKDDNVYANAGFIGATIHRSWGQGEQTASLDIINNSPLISTLNTFLNAPLIGGLMNSDKMKTIKVQGYKARLSNDGESTSGPSQYSLQIPLHTALLTFNAHGATEAQMLKYANTLPLQDIAKLIQ